MSKRAPPPPPERQNRSRAVAELLPAVGGAAFRRFGFVQSAIVSRWPDIVGDKLARASRPESLRFPPGKKAEGNLTLAVHGAHDDDAKRADLAGQSRQLWDKATLLIPPAALIYRYPALQPLTQQNEN